MDLLKELCEEIESINAKYNTNIKYEMDESGRYSFFEINDLQVFEAIRFNCETICDNVGKSFKVKSIKLGDEIKVFDNYSKAFINLPFLEYIDLNNVDNIPGSAFQDCISLKKIDSKNKLRLGEFSLFHCFSLKEINCEKKIYQKLLGISMF